MPAILAIVFSLLFLAIVAAPVFMPVIVAAKSKTMASPVKVGLILAGALTAAYTMMKYGEALDHDSDFKGFRVFALPPVEYLFAAYSIAVLVNAGGLIHRARSPRLRQPGTLASAITLAVCVALGLTFGREFMRLPFGDDVLSKKQLRAEPEGPATASQLRFWTNLPTVGQGR